MCWLCTLTWIGIHVRVHPEHIGVQREHRASTESKLQRPSLQSAVVKGRRDGLWRGKALAAQAKPARISRLAARMVIRTPHEAALAAVAARRILRSAHVLTTTARLEGQQAALSGMLARMAAGLLTAASCCWIIRSANRI